MGNRALNGEFAELPPRPTDSAEIVERIRYFKATESQRMGEYGKEFLEQKGRPTIKGIIGLLEAGRQELSERYFHVASAMTMLSQRQEGSHFLEVMRDTTNVRKASLRRAIGGEGLSTIIDMQEPTTYSPLYRDRPSRHHHAVFRYSSIPGPDLGMLNDVATVVLNADPGREFADVYTAAPFTGQANIAATPGVLEAILRDAHSTLEATREHYARVHGR